MSVEPVHDRLIVVAPAAVAVTPVGFEGAVVSGIVALALVELPEMFPAASRAATV